MPPSRPSKNQVFERKEKIFLFLSLAAIAIINSLNPSVYIYHFNLVVKLVFGVKYPNSDFSRAKINKNKSTPEN